MTKLISTNPAKNYEEIGSVNVSTKQEIVDTVANSNAIKKEWGMIPVERRVELLTPIYHDMLNHKNSFVDLIVTEVGKTRRGAIIEVNKFLDQFAWYLENITDMITEETVHEDTNEKHVVRYEPWGTVAVISPWNFPFGMITKGVVPNLLIGNTVVLKPSEECSLVGCLVQKFFDNHDLPKGVFSVVYGGGEVGDTLTNQEINMIWFTGSTTTGKKLFAKAGEKFIPSVMEMGGSTPAVVFEDVDIDQAVEAVVNGRFFHAGQVCVAVKRAIVEKSIVDEFSKKLVEKTLGLVVGDPNDEDTDMGPLTMQRQQELIDAQVQDAIDKGATVLCGGSVIDGGAYYEPTVLTNITPDMRVWQEETFGPVLPIVTFETEEEAIRLSNDTEYGLTARVMSKDKERGVRVAEQINAGGLKVSYGTPGHNLLPFGGYKSSGMGREHGLIGVRQLCQVKAISISK